MALAVGAVAFGCGSEVTRPSMPALVITRLALLSHQPINLPVTDSIALGISAVDQHGQTFSPGAGYFTWRSNSVVGEVTGSAFRSTTSPGSTWVVAETPDGVRDSVFVSTYRATGVFHITLIYADDIPARWRTELEKAARRWEARIIGELPAVNLSSDGGACGSVPGEPPFPHQSGIERGVRIYVGQSGRFPPGTYVEAVGGPCLQRAAPGITTILGTIVLNRDQPVDGIDQPRLEYLAAHEMGHVLGLVGVFQGPAVPWFESATGKYTGAEALEGWRRIFGLTPSFIPVNQASHWDTPENWDLMGSSGGGLGTVQPITPATLGALMDMGYPVTWAVGPQE